MAKKPSLKVVKPVDTPVAQPDTIALFERYVQKGANPERKKFEMRIASAAVG